MQPQSQDLFAALASRQRGTQPVKQGDLILPGRAKQPGRNDQCPCGSGRKYKKCCLLKALGRKPQRSAANRPKEKPVDLDGAEMTQARVEAQTGVATALALLDAGIAEDVVWAYVKTGLFIRHDQTALHTAEDVAVWHEAIDEFAANPESRERLHAYLDTTTPAEKE